CGYYLNRLLLARTVCSSRRHARKRPRSLAATAGVRRSQTTSLSRRWVGGHCMQKRRPGSKSRFTGAADGAKARSSKQLTSRPKQLLKTLTDNPALPAFVRTLQTPVLHKLIEHVGLRDAGDLIVHTTTEQLRGLFEVALWEGLRPGDTEQL